MTIKHTRNGDGIAGLAKRLKSLKGNIAVGVLKDMKYPTSGASLLEVAMTQEFGSAKRGIPQRSFLRSTANIKKNEIKSKLKDIASQVVKDGKDGSKLRGRVGVWFSNEVKKTIRAGGIPAIANSEATQKRKEGNNTPLVDTGLLRKSITWQEL